MRLFHDPLKTPCSGFNQFFLFILPLKQETKQTAVIYVILPHFTFWDEPLARVCHAMCVQQNPCVL